jgi:hypothetical protein
MTIPDKEIKIPGDRAFFNQREDFVIKKGLQQDLQKALYVW